MRQNKIIYSLWFLFTLFNYVYINTWFSFILVAITVFIFIVDLLMYLPSRNKLSITIGAVGQCGKGDLITVGITGVNSSIFPVSSVFVKIAAFNVITEEKVVIERELQVKGKGKKEETFTLKSEYCGMIKYSVEELRVMDMFKLFSKVSKVESKDNGYDITYVEPTLGEVYVEEDSLNSYDMESYVYSSERKGNDPSETFGIREYKDGDSFKTIHWKLTGKMGQLMVRELGLPVENSLMIILDKKKMEGAAVDPLLRSRDVELFLTLSRTFIEKELNHSIGFMDYEKGEFTVRKISSIGDVWLAMAEVLSAPYREDKISTIYHYLESDSDVSFANYILVTSGEEEDLERLENYGGVTVYRTENYR